jgi:hypothetical protein
MLQFVLNKIVVFTTTANLYGTEMCVAERYDNCQKSDLLFNFLQNMESY